MQKIIILGCAGSGKSTFARKLHDLTGIPLVHLDNIWWKPDRTHITREEFDAALNEVLQRDAWIIDGDYSRTYEVRIKAADTIFFLDHREEDCLSGLQARVGRERSDIPWIEDTVDPELVEMVRRYRKENRSAILKLLEEAQEKQIHVFCGREEADAWLAEQTKITKDERMVIRETESKRDYLPLLFLADEQEDMIDLYLDRGTMFILEEDGIVKGECVVTDEGEGVLEIQNLAVAQEYQGNGYGKKMIEYVADRYRGQYEVLQVGTGDSPLTVPFYEHCGFVQHHVIKNYIVDHYDHPIFEGGKQLIDKVFLRMEL